MLLLAQLVAPPIQPGPVRLPSTAPQQRPKDDGPLFDVPADAAPQPSTAPSTADREPSSAQMINFENRTAQNPEHPDEACQSQLQAPLQKEYSGVLTTDRNDVVSSQSALQSWSTRSGDTLPQLLEEVADLPSSWGPATGQFRQI